MSDTKTMQALVKTAKGKGLIEIREVPVPEIGDNEVLIEVKAAGICGTDLHIYNDNFPYWPPVILGHEFSGIIAETGKNVCRIFPAGQSPKFFERFRIAAAECKPSDPCAEAQPAVSNYKTPSKYHRTGVKVV